MNKELRIWRGDNTNQLNLGAVVVFLGTAITHFPRCNLEKNFPVRKFPPWTQILGLGLFSRAFRWEGFLCWSDPTWGQPGLKGHLGLWLPNEACFLPTQRLEDIALQLSSWRGCCCRLAWGKYQMGLNRNVQLRNHREHLHPLVQNSKLFPEGRHCTPEQEAHFSVLGPHGGTCLEIKTSQLNPIWALGILSPLYQFFKKRD